MDEMDWNLLKIFAQIATSTNFSNAALKCGVTRSTISKSLLKLETVMGSKLVRRNTKVMTLTEEGSRLLNEILQFEQHFYTAFEKRPLKKEENVSISIATTQGTAACYVPYYVPKIMEQLPNLSLRIRTYTESLEESIASNDIAIYPKIQGLRGIHQKFLTTVNFGLFCSPDYLKKNGHISSPDQLQDHTLIGFSAFRDIVFAQPDQYLYDFCSPNKIEISQFFKIGINSTVGQIILVDKGAGIAFLPLETPLINQLLNAQRILPEISYKTDLYFIYKERSNKIAFINKIYKVFNL